MVKERQEELRQSLSEPHPDSAFIAERGLGEWADLFLGGDSDLLDPAEGREVRWEPGKGWTEVSG